MYMGMIEMNLKYYHGIIDNKGIDWFKLFDGKMITAMNIRVRMNPHRFPKSYIASMTEETEKEILKNIEEGHYMKALKILKKDSIYITTRDKKGTQEEQEFLIGLKAQYDKLKMIEAL